ncbi:hydrolase [Agromyces rhizosphaerae]|uniref:Hydrolase n=1 Tax=Agromyces rhizosphaerae TaxID=88374 RepID=A0A9W6CZK1_9MICO|nr:C40 family peptidase [Agromyces rhizosphaerae]GLI28164.1 hydrolase [Agromyces rhizosphaerae]
MARKTRSGSTKNPTTTSNQIARSGNEIATPDAPFASTKGFRRGVAANVIVMSVAAGIVGTLALPAYAFAPGSQDPQFGSSEAALITKAEAQSVEVDEDAVAAEITTDSYEAVTKEEIDRQRREKEAREAAEAARRAAEAAAERAAANAAMTSYGQTAAASTATYAAPSTSYSPAAVFATASQYIGVPYVYGGATPAGFDCSGFVMYVFAQYGISLPHSSAGQAAAGTPIPLSQAQPGDLVIMSGHDGFYAGNGNILHAPYPGTSVRIQPIWTTSYSIVRING